MHRVLLLFLFILNVGSKAQQVQSLKIIKNKYDSIAKANKESYLLALKENNKHKIIVAQNKINESSLGRKTEYKLAIEYFLKNQRLAEPSNLTIENTKTESGATYSFGFEALYKEVHNFVKKNIDIGDIEYDTLSSKIHFLVQNDHSLLIEKVEGVDSNFNNLVLLAFLMTEGTWTSANQNGRNVKSKFVLPIILKIE